jgi:hypothetical protein
MQVVHLGSGRAERDVVTRRLGGAARGQREQTDGQGGAKRGHR